MAGMARRIGNYVGRRLSPRVRWFFAGYIVCFIVILTGLGVHELGIFQQRRSSLMRRISDLKENSVSIIFHGDPSWDIDLQPSVSTGQRISTRARGGKVGGTCQRDTRVLYGKEMTGSIFSLREEGEENIPVASFYARRREDPNGTMDIYLATVVPAKVAIEGEGWFLRDAERNAVIPDGTFLDLGIYHLEGVFDEKNISGDKAE